MLYFINSDAINVVPDVAGTSDTKSKTILGDENLVALLASEAIDTMGGIGDGRGGELGGITVAAVQEPERRLHKRPLQCLLSLTMHISE